MKHTLEFSEPVYYEICVDGRLGLQSAVWFDDMAVTVNEEALPPHTTIHGYIRDQAALYGLISRARDLGLTLISVNRIELAEARTPQLVEGHSGQVQESEKRSSDRIESQEDVKYEELDYEVGDNAADLRCTGDGPDGV